jgi:hypothetical protein
MAISKKEHQALRSILLRDGTIKGTNAPSEFKSTDKAASRANAIAARRNELRHSEKRA